MRPSDPVIRPAASDDLDAVAAIFSDYITSSVVTFEVTPPKEEDWRRACDDLAARGLPFLICGCGGGAAGYAYAAPRRAKPAYRHTVESTIYLAPGPHRPATWPSVVPRAAAALRARRRGAHDCSHGRRWRSDVDSAASRMRFTDAGRLRNVGRKHGRLIGTLLMQHDLTAEGAG